MKKLLLFYVIFILSADMYGQERSDSSKLPLQDSVLLQNFWNDFTLAVHTKDKSKLTAVCHFPFTCAQCIDDTTIRHHNPNYVKITKRLFEKRAYAAFLEPKLLTYVNQQPLSGIPTIFYPAFNGQNKPMGYHFAYIFKQEDATHPGAQVFVYVKKFSGKYKITGTEIIP